MSDEFIKWLKTYQHKHRVSNADYISDLLTISPTALDADVYYFEFIYQSSGLILKFSYN